MISPIRIAADLIWPPVCMACGEIIPLNYKQNLALCQNCLSKFDIEKKSLCPKCQKAHVKCSCKPKNLSGNVSGCIHVTRYTSWSSVSNSLVISAKDNNYKYLYGLISDELCSAVKSRVSDYKNAVITYMPREKSKIRETGIDQAKLAAAETAKKLKIELVSALTRVHAKQQKELSADDRLKNAFSAYRMKKNAVPRIAGKTVILYDDILTTGATMSAGADLLYRMGAAKVYVLAFAMRYNDKLDSRKSVVADIGIDTDGYDFGDELE